MRETWLTSGGCTTGCVDLPLGLLNAVRPPQAALGPLPPVLDLPALYVCSLLRCLVFEGSVPCSASLDLCMACPVSSRLRLLELWVSSAKATAVHPSLVHVHEPASQAKAVLGVRRVIDSLRGQGWKVTLIGLLCGLASQHGLRCRSSTRFPQIPLP